MTQVIFNMNGILNLGAVSKEEDLDPKCSIIIGGPPSDGRCDVCGRHMSELKPFGGPGDPRVGNFSGELLVKRFRREGPYDPEAEEACERAPNEDDLLLWLIGTYGKTEGERLYWAGTLSGGVSKSWECRDCIILDTDEYFEKLRQRYQDHETESGPPVGSEDDGVSGQDRKNY